MLTEQQVRDIATEVFQTLSAQSQFNVASIPSHIHNQTDSPRIPPTSVTNFVPMSGFKTGTLGNTSGVISPDNIGVSTPPYSIIYPTPIIHGYGVGDFSQFNGGTAPVGTLIGFMTDALVWQLWILMPDDTWRGVNLPLTA